MTLVGNDPINLVTGDYLLTANDLAVGSLGLPYGLVFQRYYDSGTRFRSGPLGPAWTHNFIITALPNSDAFEGLGVNSPINGASAIAALFVVFDLFDAESSTGKSLESIVIAAVAQRWLMDELTDNVVAVTQPGFVEHFMKLADGSFNPPFASGARLTLDNGAYTYVGKDRTTLSFDAEGNHSTWRNAAGATLTLAYTGSPARLAAVTNDFRRQLTFTYTADLLTRVQDDSGRSVSYLYDPSSNLIGVVDPLGNLTSYAYDVPGRMTTIIQPSFPSTPFISNRYDSLDRVMTQSYGDGGTWQYFFAGARSEEVDPYGMRRVLYNTPRGKTRLEIQDYLGLSLVTTTTFDGLDRVTETTFPEQNKLAYTYDQNSNVLTTAAKAKPGMPALPDLVTSYVYDPTFNKPVQVTDPRGLVTTLAYDAGGNLASVVADNSVSGLKARTTYTWTGAGLPLTVTDPVGMVTSHSYDEFGNRLSTSRAGTTTTFGYNAQGDVASVKDPNGNVTTSSFDLARRLAGAITPATAAAPKGLVTINAYDADGRPVQARQSNGGTLLRTTSATWTPTGKQATTTDANGNVTVNAYDLLDRLVRTTDAEGRVTTYEYDKVSRLIGVFNPAIQATALLTQTWTANGKRASLTDAAVSHITTFTYDRYDRLVTIGYPAAPPQAATTETFTYDPNGNVVERMTRAGEKSTFDYDGLNRLILKAVFGGQVVSYGYDLAGRLTSVSDNSTAIVPAVSPTGSTVAYATTYTYDALNQATKAEWDPAPAATGPPAGPLVTVGHSYDRTNRRIGQTVDDNTWLAYPAGAPSTVTYTANTLNQYATVTGLTPSYNANGNLTGDGTYTYGYDAENRLVSASGAGNTAAYAYDGRGQRKSRTVNGTNTISITDADNREVLEYDGSTGAVLRWYAYALGPNDVLNQMNVPGGTRATFLPDIQGSVIATFNSAGVLAKSAYLPYGGSAAPASPFGYTGQRIEPEAGGLYYYRARHYSSVFGRFLQVDPVSYEAGPNLYAYVINDPLNLVDPLGLIASSSSIGQNLAQGTLNLVPGTYYSGLAQQEFQQGNYWTAAGYGVASLLDAGLGVATLGLSTRVGATIRAGEVAVARATTETAVERVVIRRTKDLQVLQHSERSLFDQLTDLGSPKANWQQNSSILRQEMSRGLPIRDASPGDTAGQFLNAERNLLRGRGWTFDPNIHYWNPPKP